MVAAACTASLRVSIPFGIMMRIVISGGGHFSRLLAGYIRQTPHSVCVISRTDRTAEFAPLNCQVIVVSYTDPSSLQYALRGANLVISTIPGEPQLALIEAVRQTPSIRRFIPSSFEGKVLSAHPTTQDPLDPRNTAGALTLLRHYRLPYTVLTCGLFYERFGPGGLLAYGMGLGASINGSGGAFLVDVASGTADVVEMGPDGRSVVVCMTSMVDVARYLAAAVEMAGLDGIRHWPEEFRVRGDVLKMRRLLDVCHGVFGGSLIVTRRRYVDLEHHLDQHVADGNMEAWCYTQQLLATARGRYSFQSTLNQLVDASDVVSVHPVDFPTWLANAWSGNAVAWLPPCNGH